MLNSREEWLAVWPRVPKQPSEQSRLSFGYSRHSGLPQIDELGHISPLNVTSNQNVAQLTHVAIFHNRIVGAEFNFHGPRAVRLSDYLAEKCPGLPKITIEPLMRGDALEQVKHLEDVRIVQMRIHQSRLDAARPRVANLLDALDTSLQQYEVPVVELVLRQNPHVREPLGQRALDLVKGIVGLKSKRESLDVFRARGRDDRTNKVETFDFLKDRFIFEREVDGVEEGRTRTVVPESMFSTIEQLYNSSEDDLLQAAEIEI